MILKDVEPFLAFGVKPSDCKYEGNSFFAYVDGVQSVLEKLDSAPEIDPESLPVVKQLRAELEKAKAERDTDAPCRHQFAPLHYCCDDDYGIFRNSVRNNQREYMSLQYCVKCGAVFVDVEKGGVEHD